MAGLPAGAWALMAAPVVVGLALVVPFWLAHRGEGREPGRRDGGTGR